MPAPHPEPGGNVAEMGFVKANPLNNDYYVELWKDDPWYPAIKQAHDSLTRLIPGYNIDQIKEKFGGLRFYFSLPEQMPERSPWHVKQDISQEVFEKELRARAEGYVLYAEGWCAGYDARKNES